MSYLLFKIIQIIEQYSENMNVPKVTVLMTVYNGEKFLRKAVESVLGQTFEDFELLIINDGSTDRTAEVLHGFQDPRVRIFGNRENLGVYHSANRGLKLAQGEYVARIDADDVALPRRVEEQVAYLDTHPDVGLVASAAEIIDENGLTVSVVNDVLSPEQIYYTLFFNNCIFHSSVMFRKGIALGIGGYDETLKRASDFDLWSRMSTVSRIDCIREPLVKWRGSPTNMSTVFKNEQDDAAYRIFAKNIGGLMGKPIDVESIRCIHDDGLERCFSVSYDALLELEKIQQQLLESCPAWLEKDTLAAFCQQKMRHYVGIMLVHHQITDVLRLLRHARFRKLFLELF